jgi:predicted component of type VI protein secretion system
MFRQEALARRRYKRVPSCWETKFGRWVSDFGVPRVVRALARDPDLRVTNQAVYEWLQGHAPRLARAVALVEMSGGRLTLDAIYQHGREVRHPEDASPGGGRGGQR